MKTRLFSILVAAAIVFGIIVTTQAEGAGVVETRASSLPMTSDGRPTTVPSPTFDIGLAVSRDGTLMGWGDYTLWDWGLHNMQGAVALDAEYISMSSICNGSERFYLDEEGNVWYNWESGLLSDDGRISPRPLLLTTNSRAIDCGIILKNDGTVWTVFFSLPEDCGPNNKGKILNYVTDNAVQVSRIDGTCFVLKEDGSLWSWGGCRELGREGDFGERNGLGKIMDGVVRTAGNKALKADGSLWAWGSASNSKNSRVPICYGTFTKKALHAQLRKPEILQRSLYM